MYSVGIVNLPGKLPADSKLSRRSSGPRRCAMALATILAVASMGAPRGAWAGEPAHIHWGSITEAQVKIDQTTPLTWGVYQPEKKGKPDKKLSNLLLVLAGHRYLLVDLKAKEIYEVAAQDVHAQGDGVDTGDLKTSSRLIPTSDWIWRNVGPAELYHITLGDYGRVLQLSLPHPYLISPYY
jgi:hypothetical protein